MKFFLTSLTLSFVILLGCNKAREIDESEVDFRQLQQSVINDFTNNVALNTYLQMSIRAGNLHTAIQALDNDPSHNNLLAARNAWTSLREVWEQSESFLFGPVEDNDYDPHMDTWPTDYVQMDSLLASDNALEVQDVSKLTLSLRGFHPVEYIIFGNHGSRKASDLTPRQKKYMVSLSEDLLNSCNALYLSWTSAPENFAQEVLTAGTGSSKYATRKDLFLTMAGALAGICEEVGEGKLKEPFEMQNPEIVESPYSGNSITDFQNNITGIRNVYLGLNGGRGLSHLVAAKNKALDNTIKAKISTAISSFDNITVPFEEAIFSQRVQLQQTMSALQDLRDVLEDDLAGFIISNINE